MMSWRPMRPSEIRECLNLNPKGMGYELVGRDRAFAAWQELLKSRSFLAVAIESEEPIRGHRIVGFAASVFVSAAFAEGEAADPKPGLNARLIASVARGKTVVLAAKELGIANAQGRLNLVILQGGSMLEGLAREERQELLRQASLAALSCHDGYQVRQVLTEATSSAEIEILRSFPNWKVRSSFEDCQRNNSGNSWNQDRALFSIDFTADNSFLVVKSPRRFEPVLGLRSSDQELLAAALDGLTDAELSRELGLKLPTVKKRWASIFDRIAMAKADLLPDSDNNLDQQARGPQKRHRLLAYLRKHPEELRPFLRSHQTPQQPTHQSSRSSAVIRKRISPVRRSV
jgi:hypothetical protein